MKKWRGVLLSLLCCATLASSLHADAILDSAALNAAEKNYLYTVVHLMDLTDKMMAQQAQPQDMHWDFTYDSWRSQLGRLNVPPRFMNFHKALRDAIDQEAQERSGKKV